MTDFHSLAEWLTDHNCSFPAADHQDGVWVIASAFTHADLLPLLRVQRPFLHVAIASPTL